MPAPVIANLSTAKKIGFIVPSSNTAVETLTLSILQSLQADIIPLFTRLRVVTLSADSQTASQFEPEKLIAAAQLLADAGADFIIWNGTSGMFTGQTLADDRALAEQISSAVKCPCSTNTIATIEALRFLDIKDVSIAVPYVSAVTTKVEEFYQKEGYNVHKAVSMDPPPANNLEIARVKDADIIDVVRQSVTPQTEAVLVACTNWPGTHLAADIEAELRDVVVLDSIAVSAWYALRMVGLQGNGVNTLKEWGQLLSSL